MCVAGCGEVLPCAKCVHQAGSGTSRSTSTTIYYLVRTVYFCMVWKRFACLVMCKLESTNAQHTLD